MTRIPLASASFLLGTRKPRSLSAASISMASTDHEPSSSSYPVPLTPPYPALSQEVELRRAMAASARSADAAGVRFGVVFEDEWIMVVDKPPGVYCEAILTALAAASKPHLANRLDRDTSGLMLLAKHNKAAAGLVKSFTDHAVAKTYLALCVAPAPAWRHLRITSGHGRSKHGAWRVYSLDDVHRALPGGSRVKRMETAFRVLSINAAAASSSNTGTDSELTSIVARDKMPLLCDENGSGSSRENLDEVVLRAYPRSGRTHQIRLHCQYLGLPIRGDVKYGGVPHWKGMEYDSHALHAESLSFVHPITQVPLSFKAPPPPWLQAAHSGTGTGDTES